MSILKRLSRKYHEIYAKSSGYFWAPCDMCGEYFGGHEKHGDVSIILGNGSGRVICSNPKCEERARVINREKYGVETWREYIEVSRPTFGSVFMPEEYGN